MGTPQKHARTLWPLPGGAGAYLQSLRTILQIGYDTNDADAAIERMIAAFPTVSSRKAARSYLHVVATLGLIELDGPVLRLTATGRSFLLDNDPKLVRDALFERVAGVAEIAALLRGRGMRVGLLQVELRGHGFHWSGGSQVRYRLRWLEEVGVVVRRGRGRPAYEVVGTHASDPESNRPRAATARG